MTTTSPVLLRRAAAALLAAAALAACATTRSAPAPDAPLRVLVYNIHAGKDADLVDNLDRVARVVTDAGADVVLLQEVDRGTNRSGGVDQVAELERLTGLHGAFGRTLDYDGGEYGIAVLSRWPIRSDTLIHLPVEPAQQRAGGSHEPRGALVVTLAAPGGDLAVVNTHLDASREDTYRRQEVRTVRDLADSLARGGARVVVGGDFNSEPGSAPVAWMTNGGWRDAAAECGAASSLTFPADSPVKRIDYLWVRAGFRCADARVLTTTASDHRPVLIELAPAAVRGAGSAEAAVDSGWADVAGTRLYYEVAGQGEPVVLIHGNLGDRRHWDEQFRTFAREFRVVRYDLRGFGRSALPTEGEAYSHHEDLAALLRFLGIERAHVVGLSMGSSIAADFAVTHPEMTRTLVSVGPWVSGYSSDSPAIQGMWAAYDTTAKALAAGGVPAAMDAWTHSPFWVATTPDTAVRARLDRLGRDHAFWEFEHDDPATNVEPRTITRIGDLAVPTLIVTGEFDAMREVADFMARTMPDAREVVIPGAGHMVPLDRPAAFDSVVLGFLRGH